MKTALPTSKEEMHEWVEEYCHEWEGTNDYIYYHEAIDDELKQSGECWECFLEWAIEKHIGLCEDPENLYGIGKREIKFRAWNSKDKEMNYLEELCVHNRNEGIICYGEINFNPIVMQYTGLKDKNGKETYEGDILKYSWERSGKTNERIGYVKGNVRGYCYDFIGSDNKVMHTLYSVITEEESVEVIGNVFENPKLLNN